MAFNQCVKGLICYGGLWWQQDGLVEPGGPCPVFLNLTDHFVLVVSCRGWFLRLVKHCMNMDFWSQYALHSYLSGLLCIIIFYTSILTFFSSHLSYLVNNYGVVVQFCTEPTPSYSSYPCSTDISSLFSVFSGSSSNSFLYI